MVGTFALLGFPPFGSFLGELIILSGLDRRRAARASSRRSASLITVTFVATGRTIFPMIWGEPKQTGTLARARRVASVLPKLLLPRWRSSAWGSTCPPPVNALFRQVAAATGGDVTTPLLRRPPTRELAIAPRRVLRRAARPARGG